VKKYRHPGLSPMKISETALCVLRHFHWCHKIILTLLVVVLGVTDLKSLSCEIYKLHRKTKSDGMLIKCLPQEEALQLLTTATVISARSTERIAEEYRYSIGLLEHGRRCEYCRPDVQLGMTWTVACVHWWMTMNGGVVSNALYNRTNAWCSCNHFS